MLLYLISLLLLGRGSGLNLPLDIALHPHVTSNVAAAPSQEQLQALIRALPKAELHVHIEGTLEPALMLAMAWRNNISLPYRDVAAARAARTHYGSLQDFLNEFELGMSVLRLEQDFHDLAAAYFERAAANAVAHAEIFFDPMLHMARGVPLQDVLSGLRSAAAQAKDRSGITSKLIMCFNRDHGPTAAASMLEAAQPYVQLLGGVGLDSAEAPFPPSLFESVYRSAKQEGLHRVAHAGEEGGPDYVWQAIRLLQVERIDHGIRSLEDPELVDYLERTQLPITLCPLSNLELQVYSGDLERHLRELLATNILVTVNSDDPAYFGGYINANYEYLAGVAGLRPRQLANLACNSFRASFLPQQRQAAACAAVEAAFAAWEGSIP